MLAVEKFEIRSTKFETNTNDQNPKYKTIRFGRKDACIKLNINYNEKEIYGKFL